MENKISLSKELLDFCDAEIAKYVTVKFEKYDGGVEPMWFEFFLIKESTNVTWERVRKMPSFTRFTIEDALNIECRNSEVGKIYMGDEKIVAQSCQYALGGYVWQKFSDLMKEENSTSK